jgi:hypothetical protein
MRVFNWSQATSFDVVCRRASARRHFNAVRQFQATLRRAHLRQILAQYPPGREPYQYELARQLGVSQPTICRDLQFLRRPPPPPTIPLLPWPAGLDTGPVVIYDAAQKSEAWPAPEPGQGG